MFDTNLIVVDNFYEDPDKVREIALSQEFDTFGTYPGGRTQPFMVESVENAIQNLLYPYGGFVTDWNVNDGGTGRFQLTTKSMKSWIHYDNYRNANWGGVLYLTPNAPVSGGTGFFKSPLDGSLIGSKDNLIKHGDIQDDYSKWELVSQVGNVYNRLILFRSNQWHSSMEYFGDSYETGRLTQVFFLSTER